MRSKIRKGQYYWYTERKTGERSLVVITKAGKENCEVDFVGQFETLYDGNVYQKWNILTEKQMNPNSKHYCVERVYKKDLPLAMLASLDKG